MSKRHVTALDRLIINVDRIVRVLAGAAGGTGRETPAATAPESDLGESERRRAAALMRVNHSGEVAAQALYHGQAFTAHTEEVRQKLERAAREENDHLVWCERRVSELGSRTSILAPAWYMGAFAIGALAGASGDKWSLGFVAETERQVVAHLDGHIARLPEGDERSRTVVLQMREDEGRHATVALESGGALLPRPIPSVMKLAAKVMTESSYWI